MQALATVLQSSPQLQKKPQDYFATAGHHPQPNKSTTTQDSHYSHSHTRSSHTSGGHYRGSQSSNKKKSSSVSIAPGTDYHHHSHERHSHDHHGHHERHSHDHHDHHDHHERHSHDHHERHSYDDHDHNGRHSHDDHDHHGRHSHDQRDDHHDHHGHEAHRRHSHQSHHHPRHSSGASGDGKRSLYSTDRVTSPNLTLNSSTSLPEGDPIDQEAYSNVANHGNELPYAKTVHQLQSYISNLRVGPSQKNLKTNIQAAMDYSRNTNESSFTTKRLVSIHGERMLTSLNGICQKLEILAVLPQIMSRLALGDEDLEMVLGPECTDAILQLLFIQMAWLEARCPQPEPGGNYMGKTLHEIKRRLQKGVHAKMTKLKFPNALSLERMSMSPKANLNEALGLGTRRSTRQSKSSAPADATTDLETIIKASVTKKSSKDNKGALDKETYVDSSDDIPSEGIVASESDKSGEFKANRRKSSVIKVYKAKPRPLKDCVNQNSNPSKKRKKSERPLTEEEAQQHTEYINIEGVQAEGKTNDAMRHLMKKAIVNLEPSAQDRVFHDIFYDTTLRSYPPPPPKPKLLKEQRLIHRFRHKQMLRKNRKHGPNCRKCSKDPARCANYDPELARIQHLQQTTIRACRPRGFKRPGEAAVVEEGEMWDPNLNPLDEFLTDTEFHDLTDADEEKYLKCLRAIRPKPPFDIAKKYAKKPKVFKSNFDTSSNPSADAKPLGESAEAKAETGDETETEEYEVGEDEEEDFGLTISAITAASEQPSVSVKESNADDDETIPKQSVDITGDDSQEISSSIQQASKNSTDYRGKSVDIGTAITEANLSGRKSGPNDNSGREQTKKKSKLKSKSKSPVRKDTADIEIVIRHDRKGRVIPPKGAAARHAETFRNLLKDPEKSQFLRSIVFGLGPERTSQVKKQENDHEAEVEENEVEVVVPGQQNLARKRLRLIRMSLKGNYGQYVRQALKDRNLKELLFLIELDKQTREEILQENEADETETEYDVGENAKIKSKKSTFCHIKDLRATWKERWYGKKDNDTARPQNSGENRYRSSVGSGSGGFGGGGGGEMTNLKPNTFAKGWQLVQETHSRMCLIKVYKNPENAQEYKTRKIRLNKDLKPETWPERTARKLKTANRRLEREKRIRDLQNSYGKEVPRVAYEIYDREIASGGDGTGKGAIVGKRRSDSANVKEVKRHFSCKLNDKECEDSDPMQAGSTDEAASSSSEEEEEEFTVVVTDPYPYSIHQTMKESASCLRPKTNASSFAETIGIPATSDAYKLGSIRMITNNYNVGRMAALEMPWIGPEIFGISSDQYNSEQLRAAYREVLRVVSLNEIALKWISLQIKPEVTQAVKIFYAQVQVLQGLMYARLLMTPEEEITRIQFLKQTWIREQRLLRHFKTLEDELNLLEKQREEMMVTLNESINTFIGQIDHAYLQCHQEIVKTIAEFTKMELLTTKSADHALQELHSTLQKCIGVASILRAKYAEAEEQLQKNKRKLQSELETVISQYDTEMYARQEVLDQCYADQASNKLEMAKIEESLRRVELHYAMMQDEARLKLEGKRKKPKKKSKKGSKGSKKGKKGKKGSKKGKGKKGKSKSKGRKGGKKGGKGKKKKKKGGASSGEEDEDGESEYETETEGGESEGEGGNVAPKSKKKGKGSKTKGGGKGKGGKSKSKSKSPGGKGAGGKKGGKGGGKKGKGKKGGGTEGRTTTDEGETDGEADEDLGVDESMPGEDGEAGPGPDPGAGRRRSSKTGGKKSNVSAKKSSKADVKGEAKKGGKKGKKGGKSKAKDDNEEPSKLSKRGSRTSKGLISDGEDDLPGGDFEEPPTPPDSSRDKPGGEGEKEGSEGKQSKGQLSSSQSKTKRGKKGSKKGKKKGRTGAKKGKKSPKGKKN